MTTPADTTMKAPELRVAQWIDGQGQPMPPLSLAQLGSGYRIIYCFQHWCPGCHSSGFPTLRKLVAALAPLGVGFAVVQTVFEGFEQNTYERLRETQQRYELAIPFGHDAVAGARPTLMEDYGTGGTPWFILVDPDDDVLFSNFHLDGDKLITWLRDVLGAAHPH